MTRKIYTGQCPDSDITGPHCHCVRCNIAFVDVDDGKRWQSEDERAREFGYCDEDCAYRDARDAREDGARLDFVI